MAKSRFLADLSESKSSGSGNATDYPTDYNVPNPESSSDKWTGLATQVVGVGMLFGLGYVIGKHKKKGRKK